MQHSSRVSKELAATCVGLVAARIRWGGVSCGLAPLFGVVSAGVWRRWGSNGVGCGRAPLFGVVSAGVSRRWGSQGVGCGLAPLFGVVCGVGWVWRRWSSMVLGAVWRRRVEVKAAVWRR